MNRSITVIIPTFNRNSVIVETVKSILSQTITIDKLIIIDDGSSDNTEMTLMQFIEDNNLQEKILYKKQNNQGKSVALNNALKLVNTEWVGFNDSDDFWESNKIEEQFRTLAKFPESEACFTDTRFGMNGDQTTLGISGIVKGEREGILLRGYEKIVATGHGIMMQTVIARTSLVKQIEGFDPKLRVSQDTDFIFRLSLITNLCFTTQPLVRLDRDDDDNRLTKKYSVDSIYRLELRVYTCEKWNDLVKSENNKLARKINMKCASILSHLSTQYYLQGWYMKATKAISNSLIKNFKVKYFIKYVFYQLIKIIHSYI